MMREASMIMGRQRSSEFKRSEAVQNLSEKGHTV
jgi:hypothetical protein